jgi:hypothetical protein|tara:strand:- start:636 stop:1055 length:420 start_codon:yes stop_codon:yes gene_type:complete
LVNISVRFFVKTKDKINFEENIMKKIIISLVIGILVASCTNAKKASEVSAVYIPSDIYMGLSCEELAAAADKVRASVPGLETAVNSTQKTDKNKEIAAWIIFWPAAMMMKGNAEEQAQLANAKGQIEAIKTAAMGKDCG